MMTDRDMNLIARLERIANGEGEPCSKNAAGEAVLLIYDLHNRLALARYQIAVMERDARFVEEYTGLKIETPDAANIGRRSLG